MDRPPTNDRGYYVDVNGGVAWRGDYPVWKEIDGTRVFETVIVLALATQRGRYLKPSDFSRELVGWPSREQVRAWLRTIEPRFLRADADDGVALALDDDETIGPDAALLERHLARFQRRVLDDPLPRRRATNAFERAIAEAELELERGRAPVVLARLARGARGNGFLTHLERSVGGRSRARLAAPAHAAVARAFMEHALFAEAIAHVRSAEHWARQIEGADGLDLRIELLATLAAAERMRAALRPEETVPAVRAAYRAFLQGIGLARAGATLPMELRRSRLRWLSAEIATPLSIIADSDGASAASEALQEVSSRLGEAEDLLSSTSPPSDIATTHLMRTREQLLAGRVLGARDQLGAAGLVLTAPGAAEWATGWIYRYSADTRRAGTPEDVQTIRRDLLEGWRRNAAHAFQRLMVLARFGLWKIEPLGNESVNDRAMLLDEMLAVLGRWHTDRHGRPPSKCLVCRAYDGRSRGLVVRIRCTFALDRAAHGSLNLGVWR